MVYLKWKCPLCNEVIISNSFRHHQMDICKCGETGVDLEEYGCRYMTNFPKELQKSMVEYDYNFFDELIICMKEQGFEVTIKMGDKIYLPLEIVYLVQYMEDEILEEIK